MAKGRIRFLGRAALLFAAYFIAGRLGLLLDAVAGFATLVWPPTGISLAALVLFGEELWPAVALAAFAVNLAAGAPVLVACGISAGNTLEALAGARLLRMAAFEPALERVRDVAALVILGALVSTLLSAVLGVGSLRLGGVIGAPAVLPAARAWWVGDMLGDLVVAPLLFVWFARPRLAPRRWLWLEAALVGAALAASSLSVFAARQGALSQPYMIFPFLVWAAWRFGPYGATTGVLLVSAIAVAGTAMGAGPFWQGTVSESLLFLQIFMAVVAITTLALGSAIAERNRAVEARDEFLSIASHELSTPLTALSLQVQSQQRALQRGGSDAEVMRSHSETTSRMVGRLARLIRELLDISRVSTGKLRLEREEVDLAAVTREAVARLEQQIAQAGCAVTVLAKEPVQGRWDRARLDQVADNLIANAIKFSGGNPVEIVVGSKGDTARLEVHDHGIGIAPADQNRVFDRFERAVSRRRFAGFGLGLWIARQVVEAHGGTISLSSQPGLGSTFTVELPR